MSLIRVPLIVVFKSIDPHKEIEDVFSICFGEEKGVFAIGGIDPTLSVEFILSPEV